MLHAAVLLDLTVTAVVVGQKQTFRRNQFSGASSSEQYDSVFQGRFIYIIYVFGVQTEAFFLHVGYPLVDKRWKPHSFVSPGSQCQ